MKYLNIGCGQHYIKDDKWTNLDFVSSGEGVIGHNLLNGIPFNDNEFEFVYHSHVLEHFSKYDGEKLIKECFRVLKPGGCLRVVIPDLEQIAINYLHFLQKGIENPDDIEIKLNYDWMLIEMYDQTVRNFSGGEMGKYLIQKEMINEKFVFDRIGDEGMQFRKNTLNSINKKSNLKINIIKKIYINLRNIINKESQYEKIGKFRLGGEVHQWMYDRYSIANLLKSNGFTQIEIKTAFTSNNLDFEKNGLDGITPVKRKPDSLYIEAIR